MMWFVIGVLTGLGLAISAAGGATAEENSKSSHFFVGFIIGVLLVGSAIYLTYHTGYRDAQGAIQADALEAKP